jgi:hypothetical protein
MALSVGVGLGVLAEFMEERSTRSWGSSGRRNRLQSMVSGMRGREPRAFSLVCRTVRYRSARVRHRTLLPLYPR